MESNQYALTPVERTLERLQLQRELMSITKRLDQIADRMKELDLSEREQ